MIDAAFWWPPASKSEAHTRWRIGRALRVVDHTGLRCTRSADCCLNWWKSVFAHNCINNLYVHSYCSCEHLYSSTGRTTRQQRKTERERERENNGQNERTTHKNMPQHTMKTESQQNVCLVGNDNPVFSYITSCLYYTAVMLLLSWVMYRVTQKSKPPPIFQKSY